MSAAILETIFKAIEFAIKADKKTATAAFIEDHDEKLSWEIINELAVRGYTASFSKFVDGSYDPPIISTEYEIKW